MASKISKILDSLLARVAFDITKGNVRHSYKDYIALEILRLQGSTAHRILLSKLSEWEIMQLPTRIEAAMLAQPKSETLSIEDFLHQYREQLLSQNIFAHNIGTAHAICDIVSDTTTATSQVMAEYGLLAHTLHAVMHEAGSYMEGLFSPMQIEHDLPADSEQSHQRGTLLERFGSDLTQLAREGKIDPVIGRQEEIERVIQILSRRKKNNPILIGEAGVGKSAIVEGLALRIINGDVPHNIVGKRLFSLDVAALVAGTKYRGEFEERIQQVIDELRSSEDTILFIDEIHTIVGAGSTQGSLDAANILKPALARGELRAIGATTLDEYRQNIESDSALERRFQRVMIEPTTVEQTIEILRKIAPRYEQFHSVRYTEEALRGCVELSERYIPERQLPDKAIDIMDEVGSRHSLLHSQQPQHIGHTRNELQHTQHSCQRAIERLAYEQAAAIKVEQIALRLRLSNQVAEWQQSLDMSHKKITLADVCRVITTMTGIPAERITHSEAERISKLGSQLRQNIIGQDEAIECITRSLQRSRVGLTEGNRPIGVFLLVGPTGVGKTLLAKELSKLMYDRERALIRIDMSEYAEHHTVARLTGSPPGYVGYGEGGELTEAVRRQPYSVVLFDEVEKAHPQIFNIMLQIFDEGWLTDATGRKVDFRNTVIILTSNAGSRIALEAPQQLGYNTPTREDESHKRAQTSYNKALENTFAPEFLSRIDEVVIFNPLSAADMERIVELQLDSLRKRLQTLGYEIEVKEDAKRHIAKIGYESRYGVRTLRRTLISLIEEPLTQLIIEGALHIGQVVCVEQHRDKQIRVKVA